VARPVDIHWSVDALDDLQRFADFLHERHPGLASRVAGELVTRTELLRRHPQMGRPLGKSHGYRELVLAVLGGTYSVQYRYDGEVVLVLRILHSREQR
jgi:plasmid stabilization system protein ParE